MEDSSTTDATLGLYRELRAAGHENVGVVLQAYLRRTPPTSPGLDERPPLQGDLRRAARARLPGPRRGSRQLPRGARRAPRPGLLRRDRHARRAADRRGAPPDRARAASTATATSSRCCSASAPRVATSSSAPGHRLRVYVPFGTHWYEYSIRRLQENPKLAGYAAADTLRRLRELAVLTVGGW